MFEYGYLKKQNAELVNEKFGVAAKVLLVVCFTHFASHLCAMCGSISKPQSDK